MVILSGITQGKKYIVCGCNDRFTKVAVFAGGSDKIFKSWIFERSLRKDCMFGEKLEHKEIHNLKNLLSKEKTYINYK